MSKIEMSREICRQHDVATESLSLKQASCASLLFVGVAISSL